MNSIRSKYEMVDLLDIHYSAFDPDFYLKLKLPSEDNPFYLRSNSVIFCKISNSPGDMESPFVVDVFISEVHEDAITSILSSKGYGWIDYPRPKSMTHIKIEGGPVLDIFVEGDLLLQKEF